MLDARLFLAKTWPLWPCFEGATVGDEEQRRYPRAVPPKSLKVAWQSGTRRAVSYLESIGLGGLSVDLGGRRIIRSEEHTSELQSLRHLVCRPLLCKKK